MRAALDAGILCFNVESEGELERARCGRGARRAGARRSASASIPTSIPKTHPYIATGLKESKFGVAYDDALALYRSAARMRGIAVHGVDIHIGSQITELEPYREAVVKVLDLVDALRADGIALAHVDLGGGLGIRYRDEHPVRISEYAEMVRDLFAGRPERLLFEPGRRLVGAAGVLLTKVEFLKPGETPKLRHRRCRDERSAASFALRRVASGRCGAAARGRSARVGNRRADLRERRFSRARSAPRARAGRPARDRRGRRVRLRR